MDFALPAEIEDLRQRIRAFVASEILPLEADPEAYDDHENIAPEPLEKLKDFQSTLVGHGVEIEWPRLRPR